MTAAQLYRLCGYALVIGAIVSIITTVAQAALFPSNNDPTYAQNALLVPLALISVAASVLLLLGLPGWYAMHARAAGVSGLVGFVGIFITGLMFPIFFGLFQALLFPFFATQAPQLLSGDGPSGFFPYFIVGTLIQLIGTIGLAIPMLRGQVLPRWPGYALVISAPLAVVSFFLSSGPNAPQSALTLALNNLPVVLLLVALAGMGGKLLTNRSDIGVAELKTAPFSR
ncbi:MAG TPA: hypothetical protein VGS17_12870 [Candidatus Limnocylindria bacterium]|nr:hypothetical protein [Candidatus Limnocylindria bacterium]